MKVEFEVTGLTMARFSFMFSEHHPHENDAIIRKYLDENQLVPKRIIRLRTEPGETLTVLQYGMCYLGRHLEPVCDAAEDEPKLIGEPV